MSKLTRLNPSLMEEFLAFNRKAYPHRTNISEHFTWWFTNNPELKNKEDPEIVISLNEQQRIVGQALFNPARYHLSNQVHSFYFGSDYYVSPGNRGLTGLSLSLKVLKKEIPFIGIGPSEAVGKLFLSSGLTEIGSAKRFIWFRTPLAAFKLIKNVFFIRRELPPSDVIGSSIDDKFSNGKSHYELSALGFKFKLINDYDELKKYYWKEHQWKDVLGFSRSKEFLEWRFFNGYHRYMFYLGEEENKSEEKKQIYLVARLGIWKGLRLLFLTDYKVQEGETKGWGAILKVSKELARLNHCDGILTVSSHHFFEKEVRREFFIKLGKENKIVTNIPFNIPVHKIKKRDFIIVTLADSDQEFSYWW